MKIENYICDNDDCQIITPDLYADKRSMKWLCENCWPKYADILQLRIKKFTSMTSVQTALKNVSLTRRAKRANKTKEKKI
jgi:hypothetical protein